MHPLEIERTATGFPRRPNQTQFSCRSAGGFRRQHLPRLCEQLGAGRREGHEGSGFVHLEPTALERV